MDEESAALLNAPRKSPICSDSGMKVTNSEFPSVAPWNSRDQLSSLLHVIVSLVRFGSDAEGNEVSLSIITDRLHRLGSL